MCNIEKEHVFGCLGICVAAIIFSFITIKGIETIIKEYIHSTPVEERTTVDSLKQVNKTIIIEVEHLDSIKNEQIIKVKELDNDSTLNLFYQLIRE